MLEEEDQGEGGEAEQERDRVGLAGQQGLPESSDLVQRVVGGDRETEELGLLADPLLASVIEPAVVAAPLHGTISAPSSMRLASAWNFLHFYPAAAIPAAG